MRVNLQLSQSVHIRMQLSPEFENFVYDCYGKFNRKDWGLIEEEEKEDNEQAIAKGGDVLGLYRNRKTKDEVIVLLPKSRNSINIYLHEELLADKVGLVKTDYTSKLN